MYERIEELYPICRSITGNGVRQTLNRISQRVPLQIHEVPSGTQVYDWTVPREWNIEGAFIEDADGSLIVIDTGGWYKLCCPTSQLYKPDVLGAIYRVRRKSASIPNDPRGAKLDWAAATPNELAVLLADDRVAVRDRAIEELARAGRAAFPRRRSRARPSARRPSARSRSGGPARPAPAAVPHRRPGS